MKLNIGGNIRRLRTEKNITQDKLAEALGVSCQSVSRWELNMCYPDMELLPAIANYFDVTLDDLVGMNDIRSQERINAIFTEAIDHERTGNWPDAVSVLRDALKTYPGNHGMMAELALSLSQTGSRKDLIEAISICEELVGNCDDMKLLATVRPALCFMYKVSGQPEKALALGRTLPHIWESREMLLPALCADAERENMTERSLNIALQVLRDLVFGMPIPFSLGYKPEKDVNTEKLKACLKT